MTMDSLGIKTIEAIETLEGQNAEITVDNIVQILDAKSPFSKKAYAKIHNKVYMRLRGNMQHCWKEWNKFFMTPECRKKLLQYEYMSNAEPNGWHEHYITLKESRTFTDDQIEGTRIEALVFDWFISTIERKGWRFLIPDTTNEYHRPTLHDFFIYKFQNLGESALRVATQAQEFKNERLMLPHGVSLPQLERLKDAALLEGKVRPLESTAKRDEDE